MKRRKQTLREWKDQGGILLMGYEMYRMLLSPGRAHHLVDLSELQNALVNPGPDVIVLDEGHRIKDPSSSICQLVCSVSILC